MYGASCRYTAPYFRKYSNEYLGIKFPYQLFMSQGWHESNCRIKAISDDYVGSEGIGQITWRWWKNYLKPKGVPNLKTIDNQCKAQVLIMKKLIMESNNKTGCNKLWIPFQAYNGGWLVVKELRRACSCNHDEAKKECRRKIIHFKNGSSRGACDINYKYSKDIYESAKKYYNYVETKDWRFW
jgi:hypothetical protein